MGVHIFLAVSFIGICFAVVLIAGNQEEKLNTAYYKGLSNALKIAEEMRGAE